MNKKIGFIIIVLMGIAAFFVPKEAHAAKIKIMPSISFNNSFFHAQPRRVYAQPAHVVHHHYTYYGPYGPYEDVFVEEPVYYVPRPPVIHSPAVNFGLRLGF